MEILSKSTKDTEKLAKSLAKKLKAGDVLALYGDLGAGKTTFTAFLVHSLGIEKRVQSPTFVVLRKYVGESLSVNHLDLYRMQDTQDVLDLGLDEILEEDAITIIEWPEIAKDLLPENVIKITFEYKDENERLINVHNID